MARAVADACVEVMATGLVNTSCCALVGVLVDSALKLLQELIDIE